MALLSQCLRFAPLNWYCMGGPPLFRVAIRMIGWIKTNAYPSITPADLFSLDLLLERDLDESLWLDRVRLGDAETRRCLSEEGERLWVLLLGLRELRRSLDCGACRGELRRLSRLAGLGDLLRLLSLLSPSEKAHCQSFGRIYTGLSY